jgi:hypothetical protein
LELLKRLQNVDRIIRKIENIKLDFPIKIKQLEKELERREQRLEKEKAALEEMKKVRRNKEQELKVEMERLQKSQDKLLSVKTNKEYQAVLKEVDGIKRNNSDLETEILICMEKVDNLAYEIKEKDIQCQKWIQEFEKQKKVLKAEIEKSNLELENQQKLRIETVKKVHPDLIKKYEVLIEKRHGLAVVPIQDGFCQGCNINIPPQKFLEIQKNNNTIMNCPFCNRILYFDEE